jgi:hypothetical protein
MDNVQNSLTILRLIYHRPKLLDLIYMQCHVPITRLSRLPGSQSTALDHCGNKSSR